MDGFRKLSAVQGKARKVTRPVLFARVGWMTYYRGPQRGDEKPIGGGKYTRTRLGHEAFNFKPVMNKVYGYFQPQMRPRTKIQASTINLERIVPGITGDSVSNILVVFVATNPTRGGQWVVGWYKNGTIYRKCQKDTSRQRKDFGFFVEAKVKDAALLPTDRRRCQVPRGKAGFGQANVCYLHEADGSPKRIRWPNDILEFIEDYENGNLLQDLNAEVGEESADSTQERIERAAGFETDSVIRRAIEAYAMKLAEGLFREKGYSVTNKSRTKPYDLLCEKSGGAIFVEVKGTRSRGESVAVTKNEVEVAKKNKGRSVLFVVHSVKVKGRRRPVVSGGQTAILEPWDVSKGTLKPTSYIYTLPR